MENVVSPHNFWLDRKVFLTGHTGFKGGWLAVWLQLLGAKVTGYALAPTSSPNFYDLAKVSAGMTSLVGDISDFERVASVMRSCRPEIVFHLAAQPLVRQSFDDPRETYQTNVMGTVNLLEAVRQVGGVRSIVIVTTDKCYENEEWPWAYRENDRLGGNDPYSSSKSCAELVATAFRQSYFHPNHHSTHGTAVATARAGNVFGGGDWAVDRLVPDFIRAVTLGEPLLIRNPRSVRPWQHVLEPLNGYLLLAQRLYEQGPAFGIPWNFGPSNEDAKSVAWVADLLVHTWGGTASWKADNYSHPREAGVLTLDSSRARSLLGWIPRLTLETATQWSLEWYKAADAQRNLRHLTEVQIETYWKQ